MRQLIPSPWMSGALIIFWLLLNKSISVGHIVLAVAAGLVGGWTLSLLDLPKPHLQRPGAILRLAGRVFVDIVRSNVAVAGIILGFGRSGRAWGFVDIPIRYGTHTRRRPSPASSPRLRGRCGSASTKRAVH